MAKETPQASGVKDLIARIRDDGVEAGRRSADRIMDDARSEALRIVAEAQTVADETHHKAVAEIESYQKAALEALKMAARDTRLQLEAAVLAAFERHVQRLVTPVTSDGSFVRAMLMVLCGQVAEQYPRDQQLEILVAQMMEGQEEEGGELQQRMHNAVLSISSDMLREGVEIIHSSDVSGGARVRVVGSDVEIDLTEEAISKLLLKHLLPRYRAILDGTE